MEDPKPSESLLYKEGSEACRNYSRLTMQVRTLSQQVLIGAVIALSVATLGLDFSAARADSSIEYLGYVFLCGGLVLCCFGIALGLVDWHYQSAFTAIRNALVCLEGDMAGPWKAHHYIREARWNDFIASYFPFWILWFFGILSIVGGSSIVDYEPWWLMLIGGIVVLLGIGVFIYIGRNQGDINIEEDLC